MPFKHNWPTTTRTEEIRQSSEINGYRPFVILQPSKIKFIGQWKNNQINGMCEFINYTATFF